MATGRSNQLTKQVGEYLVASELARCGLLVATFSGNVPDYDLIATDMQGHSCPIQVKTIREGAWQFSIDKFVDITLDGNKQIIGENKPLPIPHLVCVFVIAAVKYGEDQFFILEWSKVQEILITSHKCWLGSWWSETQKTLIDAHCHCLPGFTRLQRQLVPDLLTLTDL